MNRRLIASFALAWAATGFFTEVLAQEHTETIRKSFTFADPAADNWLEIDNVDGGIRVQGYEGREVIVEIERKTWARSPKRLAEAEEEVRLEIDEKSREIVLYVDGPFRGRDGRIDHKGRSYGYEVVMDFEVKVPYGTNIELSTVNAGDILVTGLRGDFDVNHINGRITMRDITGSGHVYALNGEVEVDFNQNPSEKSSFGSLNGDVTVGFKQGLSADLSFKTFNGEVYTDFSFESLPARMMKSRRNRDGMYTVGDRSFGVRVGAGGPRFSFDGFNGNIYIAKR